jgi:hypothetical protein
MRTEQGTVFINAHNLTYLVSLNLRILRCSMPGPAPQPHRRPKSAVRTLSEVGYNTVAAPSQHCPKTFAFLNNLLNPIVELDLCKPSSSYAGHGHVTGPVG